MKVACIKDFYVGIRVCEGDILEIKPRTRQFKYITSKDNYILNFWFSMRLEDMIKYTTYGNKNRFKIL